MPKLRVLSGHRCRDILEAVGFVFAPAGQSHDYAVPDEGGTLTVSVPDHKQIAVGTLADIIRQSGLPRDLFETP